MHPDLDLLLQASHQATKPVHQAMGLAVVVNNSQRLSLRFTLALKGISVPASRTRSVTGHFY